MLNTSRGASGGPPPSCTAASRGTNDRRRCAPSTPASARSCWRRMRPARGSTFRARAGSSSTWNCPGIRCVWNSGSAGSIASASAAPFTRSISWQPGRANSACSKGSAIGSLALEPTSGRRIHSATEDADADAGESCVSNGRRSRGSTSRGAARAVSPANRNPALRARRQRTARRRGSEHPNACASGFANPADLRNEHRRRLRPLRALRGDGGFGGADEAAAGSTRQALDRRGARRCRS